MSKNDLPTVIAKDSGYGKTYYYITRTRNGKTEYLSVTMSRKATWTTNFNFASTYDSEASVQQAYDLLMDDYKESIVINTDVKIPGTNIILEAGDRIICEGYSRDARYLFNFCKVGNLWEVKWRDEYNGDTGSFVVDDEGELANSPSATDDAMYKMFLGGPHGFYPGGWFKWFKDNANQTFGMYPDSYPFGKKFKVAVAPNKIRWNEAVAEYKVGDIGPAGGWIFYDKGSYSDGWRYLEAAPSDINIKQSLYNGNYSVWGDYGSFRTKTGIGTGKSNTAIIVSKVSNEWSPNAATVCNDYVCSGCNDWFLPSKAELNLMYTNLKKAGLGNFDNTYYWSSSEDCISPYYAWQQYFKNGNQDNVNRHDFYKVRPVRAF